jgi:hypothetical protein
VIVDENGRGGFGEEGKNMSMGHDCRGEKLRLTSFKD